MVKLLLVLCTWLALFYTCDAGWREILLAKQEAAAAAEAEAAAAAEVEAAAAAEAAAAEAEAAAAAEAALPGAPLPGVLTDGSADEVEVQCTGDDGTMDASSQSTIDKIIQRVQGKALTKAVIRLITNRLKDPESGLRKLLGRAAQDPKDSDYDDNEGDMTGNVNLGLINVLTKVFGQTRTVIGYLWEFGFIAKVLGKSPVAADNFGGVIPPCAVTNAIKEFQLFNQITPADGKLTKETRDLMAKDRCGNPDVHCDTPECQAEIAAAEEGTHLSRKKRYIVKSKKWQTPATAGGIILKYYFENMYNPAAEGKTGHDQMDNATIKEQVEKGLKTWTTQAKIHFVETDQEADADVTIRFGSGQHGEDSESKSFDGPYGVLAHMYYPRSGRMHFDEAENFTASHVGPGINLYFVSAHEMGHGLGIAHSNVRGALMYAFYSGYKDDMLEEDDINAITDLYEPGVGSLTRLGETITVEEDTSDQVCIQKFTAGLSHPIEDLTYLFTGDKYIRLEPIDTTPFNESYPRGRNYFPKVSEGYPFIIADKWPGLTGPFDAAVTDNDNMISYFFHDGKVSTWNWDSDSIELQDEPIENTRFSGLPNDITAVGKYRDFFVFFTLDRYYIFSLEDGLLNQQGYPSPETFNDQTDESIAAAFNSFFNGYMYLGLENSPERYHIVRSRMLTNADVAEDANILRKGSEAQGVNTVEEAYNAVYDDYKATRSADDPYTGRRYDEEDGTFVWPANLKICSD